MATATAATRNAPATAPPRLVYLDNLRVLLISLIVLLHLAITYGAMGGWYVHEVQFESLSFAPMIIFTMYNTTVQAFALGFFFLISGYFTAASLERKGTRRFLTDRLVRLGIPLAVYMGIFNPIIHYLFYSRDMALGSFLAYHFSHDFSTGPMWFVATLLIFSLFYIGWRALTGAGNTAGGTSATLPRASRLLLLAFATGLIAFAVRFVFTVGWSMPILNFQFSYFTEYVVAFFLGTAAWRVKWFERAHEYRAGAWLGFTAFLVLMLPVMFMLGTKDGNADAFNGGMTWQALNYAMWEPFVCLGAVIGLSSLFGRYLNSRGGWFGALPPNAYAVYFIHPPVMIVLTVAASGLALPPLAKFAVMSPVVLAGCFAVAGVLRAIPGVKRVL